jgi:hypothetical protein
MIRWAARLFLLRILPRRLVPFLTVIELAMLARGFLRGRRREAGSMPARGGPAGARQLPPWREFGRPDDAGARARLRSSGVDPEATATLRR